MSQNNLNAQNELEIKLASALDGSMTGDDFISYLMDAQVFMPILDDTTAIKGFQRTTKAQPLIVEDEDGTQVLVIFTSPARAREFVNEYPGFGGGLLTEFNWVLRKLDAPVNISLNPGFEYGFDMDVEMVAEMITILPPENL